MVISSSFLVAGGLAETAAHFEDGWLFAAMSSSSGGLLNQFFQWCIFGASVFLMGAFNPSLIAAASSGVGLTVFAVAACVPLLAKMSKDTRKVARSAGLGLTSTLACAGSAVLFHSLWPVMYVAQVFNLIRCSARLQTTGCQLLHLCPAVYGWWSYILTFGLATSARWAGAPVTVVAIGTAASVVLADQAEQAIIARYPKSRGGGSAMLS